MKLVNVEIWSNKKNCNLPDKEAEEIPWNKICVDLIGSYVIRRKGQKEDLNLKSVGWFKITLYNYRRAISIIDSVETT